MPMPAAVLTKLSRESLAARVAFARAFGRVGAPSRTLVWFARFLDGMLTFMKRYETEIQKQVPSFRAAAWRGSRLDQFQIKEQELRQLSQSQQRSLRARVSLGSRVVNQEISLMRDGAGEAIGYCVEWNDVTDRVVAQRDVERVLDAALAGDLTQRIHCEAQPTLVMRRSQRARSHHCFVR